MIVVTDKLAACIHWHSWDLWLSKDHKGCRLRSLPHLCN